MTTQSLARTIGIDLGDLKSSYCVLEYDGQVIQEDSVRTDRHSFAERFGEGSPSRIVIEASCHSSWVARCLTGLGHEVIVANPRQVHLISKSDRKTDRNDARILARLGRVDPDLLRPVTHRSERSAAVRTLLGARHQLVSMRTRLVSMMRTEVKATGGRLPSCSAESMHRRARLHVPKQLLSALDPILDTLRELQDRIRGYDKEVDRLCEQGFPETRLLRQVRGVGPLVALTFVVTLDDPSRFPSSRSVGSYAGLTPCTYQSGARNPQLRISKRGDADLRRLLVTAAAHIVRRSSPDSDLKRYGARLARGGSQRDRARARIGVARKLAVLLHRLWLTGEVYQPLYTSQTAA